VHDHSTLPADVTIRAVEPGDAVALQSCYESLDPETRWHRFDNAYHPPLDFFTGLASVADRDGARLVAVRRASDGREEIVGEAGYERTPDGDGELTVTVRAAWRAAVVPVLVDRLLEQAAAAGVPNLEVDIHRDEPELRALLRGRGALIAGHDGWAVARLRVGTGDDQVTWPVTHGRPRLLIEGAGGRWPGAEAAREMGYEVLSCPGPAHGRCPALHGDPCVAAATADAIVMARPTDAACWSQLLAAHRELHPDVPVSSEPEPMEPRWTV
jgi:hypothetical protein